MVVIVSTKVSTFVVLKRMVNTLTHPVTIVWTTLSTGDKDQSLSEEPFYHPKDRNVCLHRVNRQSTSERLLDVAPPPLPPPPRTTWSRSAYKASQSDLRPLTMDDILQSCSPSHKSPATPLPFPILCR